MDQAANFSHWILQHFGPHLTTSVPEVVNGRRPKLSMHPKADHIQAFPNIGHPAWMVRGKRVKQVRWVSYWLLVP